MGSNNLNLKHKWVLNSEALIRNQEGFFSSNDQSEYTMWLDLNPNSIHLPHPDFVLKPVSTGDDWQALAQLRTQIEIPFGLTDPNLIAAIMADLKRKTKALYGQWFIFLNHGVPVGSIGLIPFHFEGVSFGRLQDVDILPQSQGQGFGQQLLNAIELYAQSQGIYSLALMAQINNWPSQWYQSRGFNICGKTRN